VADRASLEIDFGPRSLDGASQGPAEFRAGTSSNPASETWPVRFDGQPVIDYLGQLRTDSLGRLIVLGGQGKSGHTTPTPPPLPGYANNDGWFDDISDGPVTATVRLTDGREIDVDAAGGAWVLVAPPDFAPRIGAAVTLYDLLTDVAVRNVPCPADNALYDDGMPLARLRQLQDDFQESAVVEFPTTLPDYNREIQPILRAAYEYRWVTSLAAGKHNSLVTSIMADPSTKSAKARAKVFGYLRAPTGGTAATGVRTMPKLLGDNPYSGQEPESVRKLPLTRTQFGLMRRWADGKFVPPASSPPEPAASVASLAHGLDRAALENGCGGAFFPGIEGGWQMRSPNLYVEPFRLDLQGTSQYWGEQGQPLRAGHFSRQMAVPWHADFNDCRIEGAYGWWPSQRPDDVYVAAAAKATPVPWARATNRFSGGNLVSSHADMVALWYKFGFVTKQGDWFLESERASSIP
jgi:hypothetical protein